MKSASCSRPYSLIFAWNYNMVILSAGICDKIGKILVSRQFGVIPKRQL